LLLLDVAAFDNATKTLSFSPTNARVLNLGTSDSAIILESCQAPGSPNQTTAIVPQVPQYIAGDAEFLSALPSSLRDLGTQLLTKVRASYPGALKFYPKSGKYVETPDNFWVVRIQSRDESLRITIRGRPEDFGSSGSIQLKPDMTGYSAFKLSTPTQIGDFMKLMAQIPQ